MGMASVLRACYVRVTCDETRWLRIFIMELVRMFDARAFSYPILTRIFSSSCPAFLAMLITNF